MFRAAEGGSWYQEGRTGLGGGSTCDEVDDKVGDADTSITIQIEAEDLSEMDSGADTLAVAAEELPAVPVETETEGITEGLELE